MASSSQPVDHDEYLRSSPPLAYPLDKPDTDYEDTYLTRPNRYFGPDSTWLSWTKSERGAVEAIDREHAQNLSTHLLNAHHLKRKAREDGPSSLRARKGKQRATSRSSNDEELDGTLRVPKNWTAWPLPPEQVPRDTEDWSAGQNETAGRPSAALEDQLLAYVTRVARKRWAARRWARVREEKATARDVKPSVENVVESDKAAPEPASDSESEEGMIVSQVYLDDKALNTQRDVKVEYGHDTDIDSSDQAPTPMADDDEARRLLLPSIRQTLGKLDDLLLALHTARKSYSSLTVRHSAADEAEDTDASTAPAQPLSRKRPRSRSRSRSRMSARSGQSNNSEYEHKRPKKDLGLRDWSDVLGLAALTGWETQTIGRASETCATLFNENMLFRTLHESTIRDDPMPDYKELLARVPVRADQTEEDLYEAFVLVRYSKPCDLCSTTKNKCQPDSSAKPGSKVSCQRCTTHHADCSGIRSTLAPTSNCCPYKTCSRHKVPFTKHFHLRRHINTVHEEDNPPQSSASPYLPSSPLSEADPGYLSTGTTNTEREQEPYYCPVPKCPRRLRGWVEGSKMYRHVRGMHPEVDVEEVKRLENWRRGERRGRWRDESRRREVGMRNVARGRSAGRDLEEREDGDDAVEHVDA